MRRYRYRRRASGLHAVTRWVTNDEAGSDVFSDHRIIDARSLAMHCLIARRIAANPKLLDVARRNLAAWRERCGESPPRPLLEWERILREPWPRVAAVMTALDERSTALRQSSPFAGVLTAKERRRIYEAFRA